MRKKLLALVLLLGMTVSFNDVNFTMVYAAEAAEEVTGSEGLYIRDSHIDIISQPQSVTVPEGEKATFTVKAVGQKGDEPLTYQWQLSDDDGATWRNSSTTGAEYTTTATRDNDGRLVRCVVTDSEGHFVISQMARLTATAEEFVIEDWYDCFNVTVEHKNSLVRYNGSAADVVIPDTVEVIGPHAFHKGKYQGETIKTLTIPASVTLISVISEEMLEGCTHLANITVADDNPNYASKDGILFTKDFTGLLRYPPAKSGRSYTIPDTVTWIDDFAFDGCSNLTSITMPDSVTYMGEGAFRNCRQLSDINLSRSLEEIYYQTFMGDVSLSHLTIPASVKYVQSWSGMGAFDNALVYIEVDSDNPYFTAKDGVLFNKDMTKIITYLIPASNEITVDTHDPTVGILSYTIRGKSYTVPDTVTTLGTHAFSGLEPGNIIIPRSVTVIEEYAFEPNSSIYNSYATFEVYYEGTQEEWAMIQIGKSNQYLTDAPIHFNYEGLEILMDSLERDNHSSVDQNETTDAALSELSELSVETEPISETSDLSAANQEAVRMDLAEPAPEIVPETDDLPSVNEEAVRVNLAEPIPEAIPEIMPEISDLPAVTEPISSEPTTESGAMPDFWQFGEAFQALDAPVTMAEEFDIPDNMAETNDNVLETNDDTPALTAESYVPSVLSNTLCMNLGIWGIAVSLACAVVTRRRRRFLAAKLTLATA